MPTHEKIDLVAELKERFSEADNVFVADYQGLNVEQINKLRKELRENGIRLVVAKNTLIRIAAKDAGYDDILPHLNGPTAVAFSNVDPNVPARILFEACKEFDKVNKPEVRVFCIDRQMFGARDVERLAKLPPRNVLLSQLVTAVEGPISGLVSTLEAIIRELIGTIDAVARSKKEKT